MRKTLACCLLGFVLWAAACAPQPKTELRFLFWGDLAEIDTLITLISRFEEKHPDIRVKPEHIPDITQYRDKTLVQFVENKAPDVLFVEVNHCAVFRNHGMLLDLSPFVAADKTIALGDYYPDVVRRFTSGGRVYALPRDTAPICCVYYNRDLFDAAGLPYPDENWQWPRDFLPLAQKLTRRDAQGRPEVFGFLDEWPNWDAFILSNGGHYVDDQQSPRRITLDSPESVEAVAFRRDLMYRHQVMPTPQQITAAREKNSTDWFVNQKAAMFLSGLWKTPYFRESAGFSWDVVLFPRGPRGPRRFPTGGSGYAIVKSTAHPRAAWELVKFLSGPPGQAALARSGISQPANRTVAESGLFLDHKPPLGKKQLLEAVAHTEYMPALPWWNVFLEDRLYPVLDEIWGGDPAVERRLREVVEKANRDFFR